MKWFLQMRAQAANNICGAGKRTGLYCIFILPFIKPWSMNNEDLIGNIIWLIFGGFFAALGYFFSGVLLCITVVGIPWGLQCFKMAELVLSPFGKEVVSSPNGAGCLNLFCNIVWLISGGLYTALVHIFFGLVLTLTVIGIPFARQHFKLIEISLMPFGKTIRRIS